MAAFYARGLDEAVANTLRTPEDDAAVVVIVVIVVRVAKLGRPLTTAGATTTLGLTAVALLAAATGAVVDEVDTGAGLEMVANTRPATAFDDTAAAATEDEDELGPCCWGSCAGGSCGAAIGVGLTSTTCAAPVDDDEATTAAVVVVDGVGATGKMAVGDSVKAEVDDDADFDVADDRAREEGDDELETVVEEDDGCCWRTIGAGLVVGRADDALELVLATELDAAAAVEAGREDEDEDEDDAAAGANCLSLSASSFCWVMPAPSTVR